MTTKVTRDLILPLIAIAATVACNRDGDRPAERPSTTTTSEGTAASVRPVSVVQNDTAVARIADARCARELACENIGVAKAYTSHDACAQQIRLDLSDDLRVDMCPRGIDQRELDECLAAIKAEGCNNPIEKIERLAACRTSELCRKSPPANR